MYAVFQTTVTQWTTLIDALLFWSFYKTLCDAGYHGESVGDDLTWQRMVFWAMFLSHWAFSKTVKLVPHLLRNPGDTFYVPVSVLFGYLHNVIKAHGMCTLSEVCDPRLHNVRVLTFAPS